MRRSEDYGLAGLPNECDHIAGGFSECGIIVNRCSHGQPIESFSFVKLGAFFRLALAAPSQAEADVPTRGIAASRRRD
jgi:hypothetical protein